jgi:hypothetical protein
MATKTTHPNHELEVLAIFVHGALSALHVLGAVYNVRKRNWFDVVAHSAAAGYDVWAVGKHAKRLMR